jgi:hypothetical protein
VLTDTSSGKGPAALKLLLHHSVITLAQRSEAAVIKSKLCSSHRGTQKKKLFAGNKGGGGMLPSASQVSVLQQHLLVRCCTRCGFVKLCMGQADSSSFVAVAAAAAW